MIDEAVEMISDCGRTFAGTKWIMLPEQALPSLKCTTN